MNGTGDFSIVSKADGPADSDSATMARAHALLRKVVPAAALVQVEQRALANAEILATLRLDDACVATGVLLPARDWIELDTVGSELGDEIAALLQGVARMAPIAALRTTMDTAQRASEQAGQLEALRKMLLAMVQDVRVVLIKLVDATGNLRALAGDAGNNARGLAAQEALALYAPLANRLGVWQIKWELEDMALRCLDPEAYQSIAMRLDERRPDRESYIGHVTGLLRDELAQAGIGAEVSGRPKHIYSIFSKMQKKNLAFDDLFDVRAVRVVVNSTPDCYAVLGLAHQIWSPVPREFDDYIAKPKPNGYRSLHTAVVGPDDKILEVQIRTRDMHGHAEYGVAAHWRYKETARSESEYDRKIAWLRQVMEWRNEVNDAGELARLFRAELFQDAVYVLTPQGRVIDLPRGATPIDFAYHVHTNLGHHCRGARVNGAMVPLNHALANGDRVEIVAGREGGPSRDWLNPQLNYLHSNRARAKVRHWFNTQDLQRAETIGREMLEREAHRVGVVLPGLEVLAHRLEQRTVEGMLTAVARGEVNSRQIQIALRGHVDPAAAPGTKKSSLPTLISDANLLTAQRDVTAPKGILVVGVDRLLTVLAKCCKPIPPDPIVGFVSKGRGVSVHRGSCMNVARLPRERLIDAAWGAAELRNQYPAEIMVESESQPAPLREVLDLLAREHVRVLSANSELRGSSAQMRFTLEVSGAAQLDSILKGIRALHGIAAATRGRA